MRPGGANGSGVRDNLASGGTKKNRANRITRGKTTFERGREKQSYAETHQISQKTTKDCGLWLTKKKTS